MKLFKRIRIIIISLLICVQPGIVFGAELNDTSITQDSSNPPSSEPQQNSADEKTTTNKEKQPVYKTGVYLVDGVYRYYKNGVFTKATGAVKRASDGKTVYVENGIYKKVKGIVKRLSDGKWIYVNKGVFSKCTGAARRLTDKKILYVKKGVFKKATGLVKSISGQQWYYVKKGVFKKYTGLVKKVSNGRWYFSRKGKLETNLNKIVFTAKDKKAGRKDPFVQVYARALCSKITNKKMTKKQKLLACFKYASDPSNYEYRFTRIPNYYGNDWPAVYAYDMIHQGASVCFGYTALFGYLAGACGYDVYFCNEKGHGWVEINGKVYDPTYAGATDPVWIFGETYSDAIKMNPDAEYEGLLLRKESWARIKLSKY